MKSVKRYRRKLGMVFLLVVSMMMCFGACKDEENNVTEVMTGTPAPTEIPKSWIDQALEEGRTELSREHVRPYEDEGFFKLPVSVSKTVKLGDFEYTMTVPKAIFRLSDLQDGSEVFETTSILRYVGEKDSVWIASGDLPFTGIIVDSAGNTDGGGSFSVEAHIEIKRGEDITFTKVYDEFSKEVSSGGTGVIITIVDFALLDENEERTGEKWNYLLSIPFDILE